MNMKKPKNFYEEVYVTFDILMKRYFLWRENRKLRKLKKKNYSLKAE